MNPLLSFALRYIAGPVLIGIAAFFYGQHIGALSCENKVLKADAKATQAQDARVVTAQTQDAQSVAQDQVRQDTVREIYHDVPTIVDHPVYSQQCLDASGVQLIARAVSAANGGSAPGGVDGNAAQIPGAAAQH